jgi:hypothetical protein
MARLDQPFLKDMLRQLEGGDRFALSPDRFAEIFPPGHHDSAAYSDAGRFAAEHRCSLDYWPATNEIFFTKRVRKHSKVR